MVSERGKEYSMKNMEFYHRKKKEEKDSKCCTLLLFVFFPAGISL